MHFELLFLVLIVKKTIINIPLTIVEIVKRDTNIGELSSKNFDLKPG